MNTIFIGSSNEKKEIASLIARRLSEQGFEPMRWWMEFPLGSITIDRLIEVSSEAQGAVFVFGDDDKLWYRGEEIGAPRDNVLLEYGMFLSKHGRNNVIIVKDKDVKLPTDVNGLTYLPLSDDVESMAENIVLHFNALSTGRKEVASKGLTIHTDPDICQKQIHQSPPTGWSSRLLYTGITGARNWISVIDDLKYQPQELDTKVVDLMRKKLFEKKFCNIVSLGCGEGTIDRQIFANLNDVQSP